MVNKWVQWLRWYKKPSYRDVKAFTESTNIALQKSEIPGPPSIRSSADATIPPNLTLERVLSNQTCKSKERMSGLTVSLTGSLLSGSPLAFYDFYMYLKYIEFSQENLEFYIWSVFLFKTFSSCALTVFQGLKTTKLDIARLQTPQSTPRPHHCMHMKREV
jgi:hypothetical protein